MIEHENERLRTKMTKNGSFLDTHNNYVLHRYEYLFQLIKYFIVIYFLV